MKKKLNIYSNNNISNFLSSLLFDYEIILMNLEAIDYSIKNLNSNIVIINNYKDVSCINLNQLNESYLIISSLNFNKLNIDRNTKLIKTPITINHFKNSIEVFLENLKVYFHDILIDKEKLINLNNNSYCYLTKKELEILTHLIKEKETKKSFIKENILKIKSSIETNSLDSHLTRIRKKLNKISTKVKIITKSDKLIINI